MPATMIPAHLAFFLGPVLRAMVKRSVKREMEKMMKAPGGERRNWVVYIERTKAIFGPKKHTTKAIYIYIYVNGNGLI